MYFVVFCFDPCQLVDNLISPFIHALVSNMHLRIEYPKETEALRSQILNRNIDDLLVAHRRILKIELIIREHET